MRQQGELVETLAKRARDLRTSKDPRPKKIEKLRAFLADSKNNLSSIPPLPLPLDARVQITGIIAEKSSVFKSNMFPMLLYFQCADGGEYPVIFKDGDDMRQDQLVIQLFTLMDRLLRKENLDLKVTPYDVLATGPTQGMAQFIPSKTIAAIVSEHGTLLNYLRASYPDEGSVGTYGDYIAAELSRLAGEFGNLPGIDKTVCTVVLWTILTTLGEQLERSMSAGGAHLGMMDAHVC